MKPQPVFPAYRQARPPSAKRWLAAGATLLMLTGGISALLRTPEKSAGLMVMAACFIILLCVLTWGLRVLFYRIATHNSQLYQQEVEQVQQIWWQQHREQAALMEAVLLGPAGATPTQWQRLINRDHRQPEVCKEAGGKALRLLRSFTADSAEREKQLAQMLVLQWREQRQDELNITPLRCYWLGTLASWQFFSAQMAVSFPQIVLPEHPLPWKGQASLSAIIDELNQSSAEPVFLCAGCRSLAASHASALPAGEAAVLWLLGKTGKVQFSRGEFFDDDENIVSVAQRALAQSELTQPPEASFLFAQPNIPELSETGWNVTQYLQDFNWGALGELEPMVVQTLAASFVEHQASPCGWVAGDPHHTLALGIIKPYGSGK